MNDIPFLSIVTRCCRRPSLLARNIASVTSQTDTDLEQLFFLDEQTRGIHWANIALSQFSPLITGRYVYILDDDTRLLNDGLVSRLKKAARGNPDVIMVKTRRSQFAPKLLPSVWGNQSSLGLTSANCLCYVVRADVWQREIGAFGTPAAGAGHFMLALRNHAESFAWLNLIASETMQIGKGRLFESCQSGWFDEFSKRHGIESLTGDFSRLALHVLSQAEIKALRARTVPHPITWAERLKTASRPSVPSIVKLQRPKSGVPNQILFERTILSSVTKPQPKLKHSLLSRGGRGG